jgi:hypothetical protein
MKNFICFLLAATVAFSAAAQEKTPAVTVVPNGTVRTKFEYQPSGSDDGRGNARFDVRTARFGIGGTIYQRMAYKMEIDLSDEGRMKMVDAYVGSANPWHGMSFQIGYMRVPFTIDAHRAPHQQIFANRSFIAKQVGSVRDVGAKIGWKHNAGRVPLDIQFGMFNGSGLPTDLSQYWTRSFNYSAKAQAGLLPGTTLVTGYQTTKPGPVRIHMYDAGVTWRSDRWLVEGEYLRKEYSGGAFEGVNSFDTFASYSIPVKWGVFSGVSFLGRWDYLSNHSNGVPITVAAGSDPAADPTTDPAANVWRLKINDPARHRATAGVTFSMGLPFTADIRVNYEKYFYQREVVPGPSDHDKFVIEFMAHF